METAKKKCSSEELGTVLDSQNYELLYELDNYILFFKLILLVLNRPYSKGNGDFLIGKFDRQTFFINPELREKICNYYESNNDFENLSKIKNYFETTHTERKLTASSNLYVFHQFNLLSIEECEKENATDEYKNDLITQILFYSDYIFKTYTPEEKNILTTFIKKEGQASAYEKIIEISLKSDIEGSIIKEFDGVRYCNANYFWGCLRCSLNFSIKRIPRTFDKKNEIETFEIYRDKSFNEKYGTSTAIYYSVDSVLKYLNKCIVRGSTYYRKQYVEEDLYKLKFYTSKEVVTVLKDWLPNYFSYNFYYYTNLYNTKMFTYFIRSIPNFIDSLDTEKKDYRNAKGRKGPTSILFDFEMMVSLYCYYAKETIAVDEKSIQEVKALLFENNLI